MARSSFPTDVVVLDTDSLLLARFAPGKMNPELVSAKSYRLAAGTFSAGVITPLVAGELLLTETVRRIRMDAGKFERVSLLLPDSWFRINLLEVAALPDNPREAEEVVRWTLKRTIPVQPEDLRLAHKVIERGEQRASVLVVAALEKTLATIERLFAAEGLEIVLIEPIGLNIWNAIVVREPSSENDQIFFYARNREFTTAVFRRGTPIFVRSRNLNAERSLQQEIRLSASYVRSNLQPRQIDGCYLAGKPVDGEVSETIAREFAAPVKTVALRDFVEKASDPGLASLEAELTACAGVFTS